ncbi:MAG TPA: hypothetical protein VGB68_07025 [Pyrinomonadaceae bacterium]|jgi:hypothetical protein
MKKLRIKFVGKDHEAPKFLIDGNLRIDLPENQSKPFPHDHAKRILKVASEMYKPVVRLGRKRKASAL